MIISLSKTDRIAESSQQTVYDVGNGIVFSKESFATSNNAVGISVASIIISGVISGMIFHNPSFQNPSAALLWSCIALGALSITFLLLVLLNRRHRKIAGGILHTDTFVIYDASSRSVHTQTGRVPGPSWGTWESLPILFNVQMRRHSRNTPSQPFWSLRLGRLDNKGELVTLFGSFQQTSVQAVRDALKKYGIPMAAAADDGTPLTTT